MLKMTTSNTALIRQLNDEFRSSFTGGRVMLTPGICALDETTRVQILRRIADFEQFNEANAPHGEHDFIAFELAGVHVFMKIDYYSLDLEHGSDDPSDTAKTARVMTVMTAEEY